MIKYTFYSFLILSLGSILSCNDTAFIGTDVVDVDDLNVVVEDEFDIAAFTLAEDSLVSFSPGITRASYPFGIGEDPIFGRTTASTVIQPFLFTINPPNFEGAVVDSVVLEIILNPDLPAYGDTTGVVGIEVFEATELLTVTETFSSAFRVQTDAMPIGSFQGVPNLRDSTATFIIQGDTIFMDTIPANLRISLDNSYGERIINSGDILENGTTFLENFNGLELRPTNVNDGLIAFDLRSFISSRSVTKSGATVMIYYTTMDGIQRQYNLISSIGGSVKLAQIEQDYDGSTVGDLLGDIVSGNSTIFAQGMTGANGVIRLNDVEGRLDGNLINGAVLEVFGTALNNDEDLRPVPPQLELRSLQNGELTLIRDFDTGTGAISISGGVAEDIGGGIYKYTFNIVSELQDIVEGDSPNQLFIRVTNKIATLNRVVLFGPDDSTHPMTLTVTYTNI